ncbi:MAG TPA: class II aldolase/adducin family protein [Lentimicrobium sp.]|nr:class II aldolase/adducin family protein [Lentimicrobium sp.]
MDNTENRNPQYRKFVKWANRIGNAGLIECSSGNLSHRIDAESILVSESRRWLSKIKATQIVKIALEDGAILSGNKPTGELPLHLAVLRRNPKINTVLHCQSPAATALACRNPEIVNYNVIIEVPIYIGTVTHLPFIMPGSQELGDAVSAASMKSSVIQLMNHGQVITGKSYKEVYQKAVFFEMACKIILFNSDQYNTLTFEQCEVLKGYR